MHGLHRQRFTVAGLALAAMALFVAACSSSSSGSGGGSSSSGLTGTLNGSGSTLQLVYQQQAIQSFKSIQPSITVNYGGGGSGKGRTDLASNVVQFAGSDSPISSTDLPLFKGKTVLYFPILIGPITVSYNLPGVKNLKLDAPVIADIFQAKITKWNDPAIAALNPGMKLPSAAITIAHRSDSSGTTQNFSEFLVEGAPGVWKLGSDSTINWPANSRGGNANGGVAQIIKTTAGAVGYVDYADAKASGLTFATVKNKAGQLVSPTLASTTAAGEGLTIPADLRFKTINVSTNPAAYPISTATFLLVYQDMCKAGVKKDAAERTWNWLNYAVGEGQKVAPELQYAPLPDPIKQKAQAKVDALQCNGTAIG